MDLVSTALAQRDRSGVGELLRCFCELTGAYGCVLWEPTEHGESTSFFVLAQWMRDGTFWPIHSLPAESVAGCAATHQQPLFVQQVHDGPGLNHVRASGIRSVCALPLSFSDSSPGALELYWDRSQQFDDAQEQSLTEAASLVPALLESIADKVSYRLLGRLNDLLRYDPGRAAESPTQAWETLFVSLAGEIAKDLGCLEVSIFLEDRLDKPGSYGLMASTYREFVRKPAYTAGEPGPTGWVLGTARPVRVFDLLRFGQDAETIRAFYPGLSWHNWLEAESWARHLLGLDSGKTVRPLSFIAAPILDRAAVLGVIRCCYATDGPFYMSRREVKLLDLVAAQVGHYWANAISTREMALANAGWRGLVESIIQLNQFAHHELQKANPDEVKIFAEGLRVTKRAIQGADILDVRLIDEDQKELYFAKTEGQAWERWSKEELAKIRYPVEGTEPSAGAYVYNTQEVLHSEDVANLQHYRKLFPEVKRIICAPISAAKTRLGVLGICGTGEAAFHPDAPVFAQLLSGQLGLYHSLATTINRLNTHLATQQQANVDLHHQLRSPIAQARKRIQPLMDVEFPSQKTEFQVMAIRGLLRKADRVVHNLQLFTDLAQGQRLRVRPSRIEPEYLSKRLFEAASDHRLLVADRGIRFDLDRASFGVLERCALKADTDLLEQAADILLDNAFKYSYGETTIRIRGGVDTGKKVFHIVVENEGIPLTADEARLATGRGWRGTAAKRVVAEGTGLGLYILDHVMKAHDGELEVRPTDEKGITSVWLWFPLVPEGAR